MNIQYQEIKFCFSNTKLKIFDFKLLKDSPIGSVTVLSNGLFGTLQKLWIGSQNLTTIEAVTPILNKPIFYTVKKKEWDKLSAYFSFNTSNFNAQNVAKKIEGNLIKEKTAKFEKLFSVFDREDYIKFRQKKLRSFSKNNYIEQTGYKDFLFYDAFNNLILKKVKQSYPLITENTFASVRLMAFCLNIKIIFDYAVWNKDLLESFKPKKRVSIKYFNKMERKLLKAIDYYLPSEKELNEEYLKVKKTKYTSYFLENYL